MKFSIITVCRNSEKTIRRTFDSVLAQSCKDYEYIVVDGASTDSTLDIIKEYEPKFEGRMRWISEPDKGIYDAMNKGIKMAAGELVGIINSDDWYESVAFSSVSSVYNSSNDVFYGIIRCCSHDGAERMLLRNHHTNLAAGTICHQACFIAKKAHDKYGIYDLSYKISSDYEFLLRIYLNDGKFQSIDSVLATFTEGGACSVHDDLMNIENMRIRNKYKLISNSQYNRWLVKRRVKNILSRIKGFFSS